MKYCSLCGKEFEGEANFCPECAAAQQQVPPYQQAPQYQQAPYQQAPYQQGPYQQGPYQQAPYQQVPYQQVPQFQPPTEVDAPSTGFAVLCFFFPIVGLILYLVWKDKTPLKAKSCGKGALIRVIVDVAVSVLSTVGTIIIGVSTGAF